MIEFFIDHLHNENYIEKGKKIFVDSNEFGVNNLVITLINNRCVKATDGTNEFELNPLRTFEYNVKTNKIKLLPMYKNKYKIIYSIVMDGVYEEEIEADSDSEAIEIFKKMQSPVSMSTNGNHSKGMSAVCIKIEETFVRKFVI